METQSGFVKVNPYSLSENVFDLIDNQWMLVTAGTPEKFNTMTASWGGFGILWNKPISVIFIRPQRYTYKFIEGNQFYTLTFFDEKYKDALNICGSKSGRDIDKIAESGLNPILTQDGNISFKEGRLILECQKLYSDNLKPKNFIDKSLIKKVYPSSDFHRFTIGEIKNCYEFSREIIQNHPPIHGGKMMSL